MSSVCLLASIAMPLGPGQKLTALWTLGSLEWDMKQQIHTNPSSYLARMRVSATGTNTRWTHGLLFINSHCMSSYESTWNLLVQEPFPVRHRCPPCVRMAARPSPAAAATAKAQRCWRRPHRPQWSHHGHRPVVGLRMKSELNDSGGQTHCLTEKPQFYWRVLSHGLI